MHANFPQNHYHERIHRSIVGTLITYTSAPKLKIQSHERTMQNELTVIKKRTEMLSKQTTINMWGHAHLFRIYRTIDMENQHYPRRKSSNGIEWLKFFVEKFTQNERAETMHLWSILLFEIQSSITISWIIRIRIRIRIFIFIFQNARIVKCFFSFHRLQCNRDHFFLVHWLSFYTHSHEHALRLIFEANENCENWN